MTSTASIVCIVDDDSSVCRALGRLLRSHGVSSLAFGSAGELMKDDRRHGASCFLLDVQLPRTSGFELAERLAAEGTKAPVVFITAHLEETTRQRAKALGALALLAKPFEETDLLEALPASVRRSI